MPRQVYLPVEIRKNCWKDKILAETDDLLINGEYVVCKYCCYNVLYVSKRGVYSHLRHVAQNGHQENKANWMKVEENFKKGEHNGYKMQEAFCQYMNDCNIPFATVEHPSAKNFLAHFGFDIKSKHYYIDNILQQSATDYTNILYSSFINKNIYIMFDETSNTRKETVIHILLGILENERFSSPFLIKSQTIVSTVGLDIYKTINEVLLPLERHNFNKDRVKAVITDGAKNVKKCAKFLKEKYSNCVHIVCLCHNLHNLCETLASDCFLVGQVISIIEATRRLGHKHDPLWVRTVGTQKMPSSCPTRFGLWVRAAVFVNDNWTGVKKFLLGLDKKYQERVQNVLNEPNLEEQLFYCSYFENLPDIITVLETSGLSVRQQLEEYNRVHTLVQGTPLELRFDEILSKNTDIMKFQGMLNVEGMLDDSIYRWMPMVTVAVERTFSTYKRVHSTQRPNLKDSTLNRILVSQSRNRK